MFMTGSVCGHGYVMVAMKTVAMGVVVMIAVDHISTPSINIHIASMQQQWGCGW